MSTKMHHRTLQIIIPPEFQHPERDVPSIPIELLPTIGEQQPQWDGILNLDPVESPVLLAQASNPGADEVHRAELRDPPSRADLVVTPPPQSVWLDSDGVPLAEQGRVAVHSWPAVQRQAVVSADWVHVNHSTKVRRWYFKALRATHTCNDLYVGVTEASSFDQGGRTAVFDMAGNFRVGWHPLGLWHIHNACDLAYVPGASGPKAGFRGACDAMVYVEADLAKQTVSVSLDAETLVVYPLDGWECARLCCSLSHPGDRVWLGEHSN